MIDQTISHYKILAKLGEGGMGVVYKAEDNKLKRTVDLKFLSAIALGCEEKSRFLREAQAAAALNHPNICTIYAIDEVDGQMFIAMEFIEGQSLQEKIKVGPLKIDEAIKFAMQVADGLQAAHEKGITHRDIKSANIMITEKGQAKIMDFGLAKLARGGTMLTKEGMTLGTAAYMSPEQARGEVVDHRTDIWSLGVVLYEMISGRLPFRGEYEAAMMYSILNEEPEPLTSLRSNVPMDLERVVAKMLAKNPAARYQHVDELPVDLKAIAIASVTRSRISTKPVQQEAVSKIQNSRVRFLGIVAAISSLIALALAIAHFHEKPQKPHTTRSFIHPPEKTTFAYEEFQTGIPGGHIALSPDGKTLAFLAVDSSGRNNSLWIRYLHSLSAQKLAGTEGAYYPFWSPDNRFIGFFAEEKLKKIDVSGGPAVTICAARGGRGGSWNQDGVILFARGSLDVINKVSAVGGEPTAATKLDSAHHDFNHRWPWFLPDGKHFLYFARTGGIAGSEDDAICLASLEGNVSKRLLRARSNVAYAGGYLIYLREERLIAQRFDTENLELAGEAIPLAEPVRYDNILRKGVFSVSQTGILIYQGGYLQYASQLTWFDPTWHNKNLNAIGEFNRYVGYCQLSPDGKKIAASFVDSQSQNADIWIYESSRGLRTRLTFDPSYDSHPIWSPDGNRIAFTSSRTGHSALYQKSSSGAGEEERLFESSTSKTTSDWSSDGRYILYNTFGDPKTKADLWILPLFGDSAGGMPFLQTEFNEWDGKFSPDGRWIAYPSDESGRYEIYVRPFSPMGVGQPGRDGKWQVSTIGGILPEWRGDSKALFFISADNKLTVAEVNGAGENFEVGVVRPLFDVPGTFEDVSADGQRFLFTVPVKEQSPAPLTLVTNWDQEVKKK